MNLDLGCVGCGGQAKISTGDSSPQGGLWTTGVELQGMAEVSYICLCAPAHSEQPANVEQWH